MLTVINDSLVLDLQKFRHLLVCHVSFWEFQIPDVRLGHVEVIPGYSRAKGKY